MDTNRDGAAAAAAADADDDEEDKLTGHVVAADLRNDATVAPAMRFISLSIKDGGILDSVISCGLAEWRVAMRPMTHDVVSGNTRDQLLHDRSVEKTENFRNVHLR